MARIYDTQVKVVGKILQVDDAKIRFKNFEGRGDKFNREGDRNFEWVIENEDLAADLSEWGWNVKEKETPDGDVYWSLKIKIKFTDFGPNVYMKVDDKPKVKLDEDTIGMLDECYISRIDMDLRPYDWEISGKSGRTAYLDGALVTKISRSNRFSDEEQRYTDEG